MNELLTALVAASKAGFSAPACANCFGSGLDAKCCSERRLWGACNCAPRPSCKHCAGTAIAIPAACEIIEKAESWLLARKHYPALHFYPLSVRFEVHDEDGVTTEFIEPHDKTAHGRALAMARLVARVGVEVPE